MSLPIGVFPCITFPNCAEEAVAFYVSLLPDSRIESIEYFREGERGQKGKVKALDFSLMGSKFMAFDMDSSESPGYNWSISLYINCPNEGMFDVVFEKLSKNGRVLMGPEAIGNLRKASWITDKYGLTWQVVWE